MRTYALTLFFILNISPSVLACAFDNKIEKSDIDQYPIIAYLNKDEEHTAFYLYLKDEGNFSGLNSVTIEIVSNKNELIFSGSLDISKHHEEHSLLHTGFSVNNKSIQFTTIQITASQQDGTSEAGFHSSFFIYNIKLKYIFDTFVRDKLSLDAHSLYNKYNDEKLDKFLKLKFNKNRGHDL